jgi:hypothetical protein
MTSPGRSPKRSPARRCALGAGADDQFEAPRRPACAGTSAGEKVRSAHLYSWYMPGLGVSPPVPSGRDVIPTVGSSGHLT